MRELDLPVGTVTFLFTDIEGSTRLLKRVGSAYGRILARHHELVREAILRHRGREIDTQGEAFFVAFSRAKDGVAAAIDVQRAHEAEAWPQDAEVLVRIGIHAAEPELTETGYFGLGVHRAARICSVGHGGQVLLSRSAAGLVDEDETPGIELRDLGEHLLKDLERPERIYQLRAAGLRDGFPPLSSLSELVRQAEASRLPVGTVTFLTTDVEGYSALMSRLSTEQLGAWLDCYHDVIQAAVQEHRGDVLESVGDSVVAVFARAGDAVRAGVALAPALDAATWPEGPPQVRVGIHTGEAERWRSGYIGHALVRALAVCAEAAPGHVLLSQSTESLLDARALGGIRLENVGEQTLRGFDQPVTLYEASTDESR